MRTKVYGTTTNTKALVMTENLENKPRKIGRGASSAHFPRFYENEVKKMNRQKMLDNVIRKFGFEHHWTKLFARMCERVDKYTDEMVAFRYEILMNK